MSIQRLQGACQDAAATGGEQLNEPPAARLAPRWHTLALVVLIVTVATAGLVAGRGGAAASTAAGSSSRIVTVYLPTLVVQWMLVLYVCRVGRPRSALADLVGRRWNSLVRACGDLALAATAFLLVHAVESVWAQASTSHHAALAAVLPQTATERFVWVLVAVSVGFAEEVVYRGYLLRQLSVFTGSTAVGAVLQASLFGLAHGEQGTFAAVRIGLYGMGFALIALGRRSLLPVVVCHAAIDLVSGLSKQ